MWPTVFRLGRPRCVRTRRGPDRPRLGHRRRHIEIHGQRIRLFGSGPTVEAPGSRRGRFSFPLRGLLMPGPAGWIPGKTALTCPSSWTTRCPPFSPVVEDGATRRSPSRRSSDRCRQRRVRYRTEPRVSLWHFCDMNRSEKKAAFNWKRTIGALAGAKPVYEFAAYHTRCFDAVTSQRA